MDNTKEIGPVAAGKRHVVLDALRGFALLGICLANFPEFSLYSFLPDSARSEMPTAAADRLVYYLEYIFVDGKFYTIFSLLFGIGFSIILSNAMEKGANGFRIFYRRMVVLTIIGLLHLMLLWSGDILMLYAVMGMLLPLFRNVGDKKLIVSALLFLVLPIVVDAAVQLTGVRPSAALVGLQWKYCGIYGITEENFAYWLSDAKDYKGVLQFLVQGAFERMQEFVDGNRYFKVFGLFLLGFWIGRNKLYANLGERKNVLRKIAVWGYCVGLPLSLLYAYSAMNGRPWGLAMHSVLYFVSVFPLSFAYIATFCLCFLHRPQWCGFQWLSAPGRMALSNYIGQSVWGIVLFYGVGFGLGTQLGISRVVAIAACVYVVQSAFSRLWLLFFRFGPLEWLWRMLTYGKTFRLRK